MASYKAVERCHSLLNLIKLLIFHIQIAVCSMKNSEKNIQGIDKHQNVFNKRLNIYLLANQRDEIRRDLKTVSIIRIVWNVKRLHDL